MPSKQNLIKKTNLGETLKIDKNIIIFLFFLSSFSIFKTK